MQWITFFKSLNWTKNYFGCFIKKLKNVFFQRLPFILLFINFWGVFISLIRFDRRATHNQCTRILRSRNWNHFYNFTMGTFILDLSSRLAKKPQGRCRNFDWQESTQNGKQRTVAKDWGFYFGSPTPCKPRTLWYSTYSERRFYL